MPDTPRFPVDRPPTATRRLRLALLAESLLTGVWVTLAALPLVTALPALAAGCAHLRRHLHHEATGLRRFLTDCGEGLRRGWRTATAWTAGALLLVADALIAGSGLPGGPVFLLTSALGLVLLLVVGLRTAATRPPGAPWRGLVRAAARRTLADPAGSLLLAAGLLVVAVSAWQLPPLAAPATGCLTLAAVAVEQRTATD